jgi:hypothetical protein
MGSRGRPGPRTLRELPFAQTCRVSVQGGRSRHCAQRFIARQHSQREQQATKTRGCSVETPRCACRWPGDAPPSSRRALCAKRCAARRPLWKLRAAGCPALRLRCTRDTSVSRECAAGSRARPGTQNAARTPFAQTCRVSFERGSLRHCPQHFLGAARRGMRSSPSTSGTLRRCASRHFQRPAVFCPRSSRCRCRPPISRFVVRWVHGDAARRAYVSPPAFRVRASSPSVGHAEQKDGGTSSTSATPRRAMGPAMRATSSTSGTSHRRCAPPPRCAPVALREKSPIDGEPPNIAWCRRAGSLRAGSFLPRACFPVRSTCSR